MPSSTPELQKAWGGHNGLDSSKATEFLTNRGYSLQRNWMWVAPAHVRTLDDMAIEEYDAMLFLIQEWDYGGLIP